MAAVIFISTFSLPVSNIHHLETTHISTDCIHYVPVNRCENKSNNGGAWLLTISYAIFHINFPTFFVFLPWLLTQKLLYQFLVDFKVFSFYHNPMMKGLIVNCLFFIIFLIEKRPTVMWTTNWGERVIVPSGQLAQ